jgi:thymidylate synthase (FAD)
MNNDDHFFSDMEVKLSSHHGASIEDIDSRARVTLAKFGEVRSNSDMQNLIMFMLWKKHGVPFEEPNFTFYMKIPLYVAAQLKKYRISSWSEKSRRYLSDGFQFYIPKIRGKIDGVKQGGTDNEIEDAENYEKMFRIQSRQCYLQYNVMIVAGVAPEVARAMLPQNMMTEVSWKLNLRSLFNILEQRLDEHAQYETRIIAQQIRNIVGELIPEVMSIWDDHFKFMSVVTKIGYDLAKKGKLDDFHINIDHIEDYIYHKVN